MNINKLKSLNEQNVTPFTLKSLFKDKIIWLVFVSLAVLFRSLWIVLNPVYSSYVFASIEKGIVNLSRIVILGILVLIWGSVSVFLQGLTLNVIVNKINLDLNNRYIHGILKSPVQKLSEIGDGAVMTHLTSDIGSVSGIVNRVVDMLNIPIRMVMSAAILLYANYKLAIIVLVLLPLVAILGKKVGNISRKINEKYLTNTDSQLKIVSRILKTINVIKTYAVENLFKKDFSNISFNKYKLEMKKAKYTSFYNGLIDFIIDLPFIFLFLLGAFLFQSEGITVAILLLFLQSLNNISVPFTNLGNIYVQYQQTKVSIKRLKEILDSENIKIKPEVALNKPIESVRFNSTGFQYKEKSVLNNFNFLLSSGKYYAVIGENGCGKSTFIKLLLNLYNPVSGSISANDIDYKNLNFDEIRNDRRLVYIEDEPMTLFDDFDRNIIFEEEKDEARFRETLEAVGLDTIYDEISQKTADELSAGQKQRVSIARGLYHLREGSVLVMDEPFSSMDAVGVKKMHELFTVWQKRYNLTVIEITHNLSDMDRFDRIYMFENGKIIVEGTHQELMNNAEYQQYVQNYISSINN